MKTIINASHQTVRYWWVHLFMGILFILMGFWVISRPISTYLALSAFFSVLMFISGFSGIILYIYNRKTTHNWGWHLTGSIIDFIVGIILISHSDITIAILPLVVAFWFMFRGFFGMGLSFEFKKSGVKNWWITLSFGILAIIFSFMIIDNPALGRMSIVYLTAFALYSIGFMRMFLAFNMRDLYRSSR